MNINLKKVISSVAALAMSLSCFTAFAADFSDVEATSTYKNAIDELSKSLTVTKMVLSSPTTKSQEQK